MSTDRKQIDVAVIGGGIAGLTLAIGLQKYAHLNVQVYEAAERFSEIGAGIVFGPNAQRAMHMIDPRIHEAWQKRAAFNEMPPDESGLHTTLEIRKGQHPDLDQLVTLHKHKLRGSTMHRAHFLDEVVKLLEPHRAHFGKRLRHVYQTIDDASPNILHFGDGTTATADIVIGADGIHSTVRKHILGPDHPAASAHYTGHAMYRAIVPIANAKAALGDIKQKVGMHCGRDGVVFGYPINNFTQYFLSITAFNYGSWEHEKWQVAANVDAVKAKFADWDDFTRRQVGLLPDNGETLTWSIWEMPPAPFFFRGRVAVTGDAAHASAPFQGAGAGQAIEDALVLEKLLGKYLDPNSSPTISSKHNATLSTDQLVPCILQAYDTVRRFRAQKVVTSSQENGRILSGNEPGIGARAADIKRATDPRQQWIVDLDQEQQIKDACQIFEACRDAVQRHAEARIERAKI